MKKVFVVLFTIFLTGCMPAALVAAGATAGGAVIYDQRSFKTMAQDRGVTQKALSKLRRIPALKGTSHISLATFNHVVLMVGQTETPEERQLAYDAISKLPNVQRIYNEISIGKPTSFGRRTGDSWITTKIKSAMLAKPGLHSTQIKVMTENGNVYLMGIVSRKQAKLAADLSRRISGVHKVVKVFQYS